MLCIVLKAHLSFKNTVPAERMMGLLGALLLLVPGPSFYSYRRWVLTESGGWREGQKPQSHFGPFERVTLFKGWWFEKEECCSVATERPMTSYFLTSPKLQGQVQISLIKLWCNEEESKSIYQRPTLSEAGSVPAMGTVLDALCFIEPPRYASILQMRKLSLREENMLPEIM